MALDERQQQIKEGAGLEESRLNVEFIDWLRRWSTPLLVVIAVVVLSYVLYERWQLSQKAGVDRAFTQLDAITESQNPSPESLKALADEFSGIRAVPHLARLAAADLYLQAARRGVRVGANLGQDGALADAGDLLTDEQRKAVLSDAEALYNRVLSDTGGDRDEAQHAINAAYGLAAVAECRADPAVAATFYKRVVDLAQAKGFKAHVDIATRRMASLPNLEMPALYAAADLPKLPWADELNPPPPGPLPELPESGSQPTPLDPAQDPGAAPATPPTTPTTPDPGAPPPANPEETPAPAPAPAPQNPPDQPPPP